MSEKRTNTYQEIKSQPDVWAEAIKVYQAQQNPTISFWKQGGFDQVIFTGCGSTYYLSRSAAAIFQSTTSVPSFAYPASELIFFPELAYPQGRNTLLVTVSRSGETTETLEAIPVFRRLDIGKVLAVTCYSDSSLAKAADYVLAVDASQEKSIAQTRSFTSMVILIQALAGHLAGGDITMMNKLPAIVSRLFGDYEGLAKELAERADLQRFFFLGSGLLNGIANEAMLKMKEMSLSYSEAFHMLEFRHGPMSMVDESVLVVGLLSNPAFKQETAVLKDMKALGASILAIGEEANQELIDMEGVITLNTQLPEWGRPVTYLPILQLMAFYRSLFKGLDPDKPTNLESVIQLSPLISEEE